jgi:bifunctional N-acetylglucosamine-1-phosphate-uridyltransferase/glucosamine-1-phosphate-acetyltransferase GlmU-like protein
MAIETHAIIMAGGEGKRMNSNIPKVLHCVIDEEMIVSIVRKVISLNISKIFVVCGRHINIIKQTINKRIANENNQCEIVFVQQIVPRGTGDAIKYCLPYINKNVNILILNGDTPLIDNSLDEFIKLETPCLMVSQLENPFGQGRIIRDANGNFNRIVEEKDANDEEKKVKLVNCGVYHVSAEQLLKYVPLISDENAQKEYYLTDVCKFIKDELNLFVLPQSFQYELMNVNTHKELMQARKVAIEKSLLKNNIQIRKLNNNDFSKGYLDLLCELSDTITEKNEDMFVGVFGQMEKNANHHIYVLEDTTTNTIIGSATLLIEPKFIHNGMSVGHIEDVVVSRKVQSKGLGKCLILYLTTFMEEMNCYKFILDCNENVKTFYSKCGYSSKAIQMSLYN